MVVSTTAEQKAIDWFDEKEIEYTFQSSLLGTRAELGFTEASFLLPGKRAVRIFSQPSSKQIFEKEVLKSRGYQVIDLNPMKILVDPGRELAGLL